MRLITLPLELLVGPLWKLGILCNFFSEIRFSGLENKKSGPNWWIFHFSENSLQKGGWGALIWSGSIFFVFSGKFYEKHVWSSIWKKCVLPGEKRDWNMLVFSKNAKQENFKDAVLGPQWSKKKQIGIAQDDFPNMFTNFGRFFFFDCDHLSWTRPYIYIYIYMHDLESAGIFRKILQFPEIRKTALNSYRIRRFSF